MKLYTFPSTSLLNHTIALYTNPPSYYDISRVEHTTSREIPLENLTASLLSFDKKGANLKDSIIVIQESRSVEQPT